MVKLVNGQMTPDKFGFTMPASNPPIDRPGGLIRDRTREGLHSLVDLYENGLVLPELHVLQVEEFVQALRNCKSGMRRGKAVVRPWGDANPVFTSNEEAHR